MLIDNAFAHGQTSLQENYSWFAWDIDIFALSCLLVIGVLYHIGQHRVLLKKGIKKENIKIKGLYYYLGLFILALALLSPIDTMSNVLAWAHMLQHSLILMVASPLMVLGSPGFIAHWTFSPKGWRYLGKFRKIWKWIISSSRLSRPILAWLIYSLTLWIWHIPLLYEAALSYEWLHDIQHISFFVTSFYFWKILFDPYKERSLGIINIFYTFIASLHGIILGALMALSPNVWYKYYSSTAPDYGYTALQDQQIAGFIMWMPAGISYVIAILFLIFKILIKDEKAAPALPPQSSSE